MVDWPVTSHFPSKLYGFSLELGASTPLRAFIAGDNMRLVFATAGLSQAEGRRGILKEGKGGKEVIISRLLGPDKRSSRSGVRHKRHLLSELMQRSEDGEGGHLSATCMAGRTEEHVGEKSELLRGCVTTRAS